MRRLILATFAALLLLSMATVADARPLFGDGSWIVGGDTRRYSGVPSIC